MRINRFLARCGVASRRKSEELILNGRVLINGTPVKSLGTEVKRSDEIQVDSKIIRLPDFKYFALNKPPGYTTTREDKFAEKTIFELLPDDKSLYTVGRLDKETSGLILITNDGDFGQKIIHPTNKIPKNYYIKLKHPILKINLDKLTRGVELDDGLAKAIAIKSLSEKEIVITIEEGRNRIVRRMIKAINNDVIELKRISIGEIKLDLPEGEYRALSKEEIKKYV
ncbi:rRNA pseudouridine synthase [Patescibacteria group bacterium]|nr:rRNA pseudouridine synthase [Patescibacteria group bacterium]